jgi:gamma-butyrobetaine dioxygenase
VTWHVSVDLDPNSTANTNARLPAHSDLPSRETPPGFQLLHCLENTVSGGQSTMTDGLAVINYLQAKEPDVFRCLTTLEWTFFNRDANHDHRWTGPVVDKGDGRIPWTFRAFHPVRGFPAMSQHEIGNSYRSLQRLGEIANSAEFQIRYELEPGDLIAFDNRRIMHGRESFDSSEGTRQLRGTYLDADEVYSRMRVLARAITPQEQSLGLSNIMEDEDE